MRASLLLLLAVALVAPATASAGLAQTVTRQYTLDGLPATHARYTADPGERNVVSVSHASNVWTFADAGARIVASTGCIGMTAMSVRCVSLHPEFYPVIVELGDADDSVTLAPAPRGFAEGGLGDDVLRGGLRDDRLLGGPGDDTLIGGAGDDHLDGGTDRDSLRAGAGDDLVVLRAVPRRLSCGPGADRIETTRPQLLLDGVVLDDCERIGVSAVRLPIRPRRVRGGLAVTVRCATTLRCGGSVRLLLGNRVLGRRSYAMGRDATRVLRFAVRAADRRRLARQPVGVDVRDQRPRPRTTRARWRATPLG